MVVWGDAAVWHTTTQLQGVVRSTLGSRTAHKPRLTQVTNGRAVAAQKTHCNRPMCAMPSDHRKEKLWVAQATRTCREQANTQHRTHAPSCSPAAASVATSLSLQQQSMSSCNRQLQCRSTAPAAILAPHAHPVALASMLISPAPPAERVYAGRAGCDPAEHHTRQVHCTLLPCVSHRRIPLLLLLRALHAAVGVATLPGGAC